MSDRSPVARRSCGPDRTRGCERADARHRLHRVRGTRTIRVARPRLRTRSADDFTSSTQVDHRCRVAWCGAGGHFFATLGGGDPAAHRSRDQSRSGTPFTRTGLSGRRRSGPTESRSRTNSSRWPSATRACERQWSAWDRCSPWQAVCTPSGAWIWTSARSGRARTGDDADPRRRRERATLLDELRRACGSRDTSSCGFSIRGSILSAEIKDGLLDILPSVLAISEAVVLLSAVQAVRSDSASRPLAFVDLRTETGVTAVLGDDLRPVEAGQVRSEGWRRPGAYRSVTTTTR